MQKTRKKAEGFAHGKVILIGEHSVVYNEPAIALPFTSAQVKVVIEKNTGPVMIDSFYYQGELKKAPKALANLKELLHAVTLYLNEKTDGMKINIHSNIPAERGMGSSAAVATAFVRALFHYFNQELRKDLLDKFVSISEEIAHGNPSGIDAKVVQSDEAIYFIRCQKAEPFDSSLPAYLVLADTGEKGETIHAVQDVGKLVADERSDGRKWIKQLGQLTVQARKEIEEKNIEEVGKILSKAQLLLQQLTVSNQALDHLVKTAMANGALGSKLTGGGRGGSMIALVRNSKEAEQLSEKLLEAHASKVWIHSLGGKHSGK